VSAGTARYYWRKLRTAVRHLEEERRLRERFPTAVIEADVTVVSPDRLRLGDNVMVQRHSILHCGGQAWCDGRGGIALGDNVGLSHGCLLWGAGTIELGRNVNFGPGVMVFSSQDRFESDPEERHRSHDFAPVRIEDDARVFSGTIIGPGVTIGRGAVIAGNAVVVSDVPAMEMWGGTPARRLRTLDEDRWRPTTRDVSDPRTRLDPAAG
jgi:acetyltransferase-like isoleucine patch superfamily enzyme